MNIAISINNDTYTTSIINTLQHVLSGHLGIWNPRSVPIYDLFDQLKPDVFICHLEYYQSYFQSLLEEFKNTKCLILVPANTTVTPQLGSAIPWQQKIAADLVGYGKGIRDKYLATDLLYIAREPNKILENMVIRLGNRVGAKIFGEHQIPTPNYLGLLTNREMANAYASSKICIDNLGTCFDAVMNDALPICITDKQQYDNLIFPSFQDFDELLDYIKMILASDKQRKKTVEGLKTVIVNNHTYFHHLSQAFAAIDCMDISNQLIQYVVNYK